MPSVFLRIFAISVLAPVTIPGRAIVAYVSARGNVTDLTGTITEYLLKPVVTFLLERKRDKLYDVHFGKLLV